MENGTFPNYGICDPARRTQAENILGGLLILLLSFVSMTGNSLVLLSFVNCSQLRQQKGTYFVANLALCDFLCSVYAMIPSAAYLLKNTLKMAGTFCHIHGVIGSTLFTASNLSLAAINADRAIAIYKPFEYPNLVTAQRARITVACIWIHCFCLAVIPGALGWVEFQSWELMCSPVWSYKYYIYSVIAATFCFCLPSTLVLVSNMIIVYAIRHSRSVVFQNSFKSDGTGQKLSIKTYTRTLRSLYILVFVYFLCVMPYYLVKIGSGLRGMIVIIDGSCLLPTTLLYTTPAVNPLIYAILRRDHRQAFMDTLSMLNSKFKELKKYALRHLKQDVEQTEIVRY